LPNPARAEISLIRPKPEVMHKFGNKVAAGDEPFAAGVAVMPATGPLQSDKTLSEKLAAEVG